jgi:PAS domain S-box-containing protein
MNPRHLQTTDLERDARGSAAGSEALADFSALRDSEQRFRQIAEAIDHVFWVTELQPAERVSYVSPAFERIWGRSAEALYADARLWVQYIHPDDRASVGAAFERWLHEPDRCGYAVEYRIVRPDGEQRWIADRGQLARDADNRIYRATGVAQDITARKRAEARAFEMEQQFRVLAESLPQLVWTSDPAGACDYLGPQWIAYTGLPVSAQLGAGWVDLLHPEDRTGVTAQWLQSVQSGAPFARELRLRRHDGAYHWFMTRSLPQRDDAGRVLRWFGTCTDIQGMKESAAALQQERDRIARIAEVAPAVVCAFRRDAAGRYSFPFGSERVGEFYGLPAAQMATDAAALVDLVHPSDAGLWESIENSGRTLTPFHAEFRVRHPQRGEMWVDAHSMPVAEPDGAIVWHGTITDITERKRSEHALAQSEAQFEAVFANLGEGVAVCTPQGQLTHWNRAAYEMHDIEAPSGMPSGHQFDPLFEVHDASGAPVPERDWALARILRGEVLVNHEAHVHNLAKGWHRVFNYGGSLVRDADGQPRFAVMHMSDITERKRAEAEIHTLNTQLEQRVQERTAELRDAVRELEAFSYSVSHDLRAPLRALDGFSQALLQDHGGQLPETGQRYLKIIRESAQKMGQLIDDLLAFSRVGRQQPKVRAVDHAMLVRSALLQLAPMLQGRQVDVRVGELPPGLGDPAMLQQVWVNLLSNALKYSRNTAAAVVEVGSQPGADGPEYFVRDNGTGFDMRYAHKLFGVFERLHRSEDFEGTGVGLAIVQRIVQRHGGSIRAEAELGRGATFTFQLGNTTDS